MKNLIILLLAVVGTQFQSFSQNVITSQKSTTQGFAVHAEPGFFILDSDDIETDSESGISFGGGVSYGFSELIEAFVDVSMIPSVKNKAFGGQNYSFFHLDLGVRFNFGNTTSPLRPHLEVGYAIGNASGPVNFTDANGGNLGIFDVTLTGTGLSFGGGLKYHVSTPFAIVGGLRFMSGNFGKQKVEGFGDFDLDADYFSTRIFVGASYRLF